MNDVTLANDITVTEKRPVVCIVGTLRAVDLTHIPHPELSQIKKAELVVHNN
jgi:hypothetical protein